MFTPSREEARKFLFDTWRKYRGHEPLSGLEQITLQVMVAHPEYHALLNHPEHYLNRDYQPDEGATNPFLHLSLHLALEEQLSIDQPPGIKAEYDRLARTAESEHDAQHLVIECLAETMWQAQRLNGAPDQASYLACISARRRALAQKKAGG